MLAELSHLLEKVCPPTDTELVVIAVPVVLLPAIFVDNELVETV